MSVKRVVGLPGDTIRMSGFMAYIRPPDAEDFFEETSLIEEPYTVLIDKDYLVEGWENDFPFTGNMEEIVLGEHQYFVLGDNRTVSSDSRSWGALPLSRITGKCFFRYWPFNAFGSI